MLATGVGIWLFCTPPQEPWKTDSPNIIFLVKPILASAPQHWVKSWRQRLGWSKKDKLYCFARQRGPQQGNALKIKCLNLEVVVRSFIVKIQRGGCDQFVDILWIGWWWGRWESASSTFRFQSVWGVYVLVGSIQLTSPGGGFSISNQFRDIFRYIPWWGARILPQGCTIVTWLFLPCLCISFLPWLASEPALWNLRKVMEAEWSLFPVIKKQGTQKGFCTQEPHRVLLSFNCTDEKAEAQ